MVDQHTDMIAPHERDASHRRFGGPEGSVLLAIGALLLAVLVREVTGLETVVRIGAFDVGAADPAFPLLCLAAVRCWLDKPLNINAATIPALILAALLCVSFARGLERSVFLGTLWLRSTGFLLPMMIIGATLRPRAETFAAIRTMIVATGVVLALVVLMRAAFGTSLFFTRADIGDPRDINDGGRAISNRGAIIIAMAMLLTLGALLRPMRAVSAPAVAMLACLATGLLLSAQATAVIAASVASIALIVLERPFSERSILGIGTTLLVALLYLTSERWMGMLPASARGIIRHRVDNLGTRQAVWESFSSKYGTLPIIDRVIGIPAGSDPNLYVYLSGQWRYWQYSLHSMYVGMMSSAGIAGLSAYVALLLACFAISAFLARTGGRIGAFTPALSIAFILLAAIQSYSYEVRQESLIMILLPLLLVAQARRTRTGEQDRADRLAQDRPASA